MPVLSRRNGEKAMKGSIKAGEPRSSLEGWYGFGHNNAAWI
jgi:hypothetical protein